MRKFNIFAVFLLITLGSLSLSCIHEYPMPVNNGVGEDPTSFNGYIELHYDLCWENIIHDIDFSTKAGYGKSHRFTVEVCREGHPVFRDIEYIDDEEFATGRFRRKLSKPLEAGKYEIAVWYDRTDAEENVFFNSDDLSRITIQNTSTTDTLAFQCAYASDILDLRDGARDNESRDVVKHFEMQIPAARFQVVATDIQDFITNEKEALNQGDKFTVQLDFSTGGYDAFDAYSTYAFKQSTPYRLSGPMRLPFAEYTELTIAQGLVFCTQETSIGLRLTIVNSAHIPVSRTEVFSFPVKAGYKTIIKGNFLSHPVDGVFNVDHIWGGEIIYEI